MNYTSRVLFITHHSLYGNGGGCFASRAYINAFASLFDSVTLLYPSKGGKESQFVNSRVEQIPVAYDIPKILKLKDLIIGRIHRYFDVTRWIGKRKFDLVVFDTSMVSYRLIDYFKRQGSHTIVIHHNYQYEYFKDNTKFPLSIPTLYWCKKYEGDAVRKADLNLTLTNQDTKLLQEHYGTGKENFAKIGTFEYKTFEHKIGHHEANGRYTFVITGTLGSYQTYQSLKVWFENYYNILKSIFPDSKLIIAGKNPTRNIIKITSGYCDIELIPNPVSMDEILNRADCYICPTSLGGGLKLRIMDGLSHGLPVMTHEVSARGYDEFEVKGYLFSYSDKKSFKTGLEKIKTGRFVRRDIIAYYNSVFSFDVGVKRLKKQLDALY